MICSIQVVYQEEPDKRSIRRKKRCDLEDEEGGDKHADQGRGQSTLDPSDPGGRNDNPHLCGQLQAQQVLRCCCEKQGGGVHRALELCLHQELAKLAGRLSACDSMSGG